MSDLPTGGGGGEYIAPGTIVSVHPLMTIGVGLLIDGGETLSGLSNQSGPASLVYEAHPVEAKAAPVPTHAGPSNPVQLMQSQLAMAYHAPDMHHVVLAGDWSLIAGDHHDAAPIATALDATMADYAYASYIDDVLQHIHTMFDESDGFGGFSYHGPHFGTDLFATHTLSVENYM